MTIFDTYATDYERALAKNLKFVPGGTDYYYKNRVSILARCIGELRPPKKILDFGGGIGLAIPHLLSFFPDAEITITDESSESLRVATGRYPSIQATVPSELPRNCFDVAFVAGVLHHVQPSMREGVVDQIVGSIVPGGLIVFFELNPLNPVTRQLVRMCPFDCDAVLMRKTEVENLCRSNSSLTLTHSHYTVFFPPLLKPLHSLERLLRWCPIGAQYFVAMRKNS
jgi:2-polyprenyl-3-methyl-5-hydroxy-6-metoxy-1,4-benzoquinol methylase